MEGRRIGEPGGVVWLDQTVERADEVRDFYAAVVGWRPEGVDMGGYQDFNMLAPQSGRPAAGVCFRRGGNADVPAGWIVYLRVADLEAALAEVEARGGEVLSSVRVSGGVRYAMIRDPGGSACALAEEPVGEEVVGPRSARHPP